MYITDLTHGLDEKGAVQPQSGPAKVMADFFGACAAAASGGDSLGLAPPHCFKCKKSTVNVTIAQDSAVYWHCPQCHAEGRITGWQHTLWDMRETDVQRN